MGNKYALGAVRSQETRRKMAIAKIGNKSRTGMKHTPETLLKMSQSNKGKTLGTKRPDQSIRMKERIGDKSPRWKGGVSFLTHCERLEIKAGRKKPITCDICGGTYRICFDHCHTTGKFRGWICNSCNAALGHVRDDVGRLHKMIVYLNKFNESSK